jgi:hypothetical protein
VFESKAVIPPANVAEELGLPEDWLNYGEGLHARGTTRMLVPSRTSRVDTR